MVGPPITLSFAHAKALLSQFHETARLRDWESLAVEEKNRG